MLICRCVMQSIKTKYGDKSVLYFASIYDVRRSVMILTFRKIVTATARSMHVFFVFVL